MAPSSQSKGSRQRAAAVKRGLWHKTLPEQNLSMQVPVQKCGDLSDSVVANASADIAYERDFLQVTDGKLFVDSLGAIIYGWNNMWKRAGGGWIWHVCGKRRWRSSGKCW